MRVAAARAAKASVADAPASAGGVHVADIETILKMQAEKAKVRVPQLHSYDHYVVSLGL